MLPLMAMVVIFFLFPLVNAIYYAFVDFNGLNQSPPFIGLGNFLELATDPAVGPALLNNAIWIVIGTAAPLIIGFALALLMWKVKRGSLDYRVAFFLPYVVGVGCCVAGQIGTAPRNPQHPVVAPCGQCLPVHGSVQ